MRVHHGICVIALLAGACGGEDKNYGDPLEDPSAALHATGAITNTAQLRADTANDTGLNAVNALSGNVNILAGIKLQAEQGQQPQAEPARDVDAACVVLSNSGAVYEDCEWAGNVVNGSITRSGESVALDLTFVRSDTDTTTTIGADGSLVISDVELGGYLDIDLRMVTEGGTISARFDSDFDVTLAEGCAVDGTMELHAVASAGGSSQSVWVLAEYGPTCEDIVVR